MKKLLIKISFVATIIIIGYLILYLSTLITLPLHKYNYFSINKIKQDYIKNIKLSKAVLVGGSNMVFGINSQKIEEETNISVVNMGLHAGIGLDYMLSEVEPYIKKGDLVLLSPEYEHFYTTGFTNHGKELAAIIATNPNALRHLTSFKQIVNIIQFTSTIFETMISGGYDNHTPYSTAAFDKWGDIVRYSNTSTDKLNLNNYTKLEGEIDQSSIDKIIKFSQLCAKKEAILIYVFPAYAQSLYNLNQKQINMLYDNLKTAKINVRSYPSDFVFSDSIFIDSGYHLGEKGVKLRTEKLIKIISEEIKGNI